MMDPEVIKDFESRIENLREVEKEQPSRSVTSFVEVTLTEKQMEVMCNPMFGWDKENLIEYYRGKINHQLVLKESVYVTREDQCDFQYLIDLGVYVLQQGIIITEENLKKLK